MEDEGNPRKFCQHLKPLLSSKSKGEVIKFDSQTNPKQVSNIFNEFYTTIGCKLNDKINPLSQPEQLKLANAIMNASKNL